MSEKLTSEQIEAITKAVEEHIKASNQNVTTQQVLPVLLSLLNSLPTTIANFIVTPVGGVTTALTGLLNGLIGVLTGAAGLLASSGLAPNLVNVIKQQVPIQQQPNSQQPNQK